MANLVQNEVNSHAFTQLHVHSQGRWKQKEVGMAIIERATAFGRKLQDKLQSSTVVTSALDV